MDNFWDVYNEKAQIFENELDNYFKNAEDIPDPLFSAMKYSAFSSGKRLRPVLLLASCELFGGDFKQAVSLALAVELIHTYSLIHDDLPAMDDDDLRRGRPTNHKIYGEGMAILAGDALLNLAYEIILNMAAATSDAKRYLRAASVIAEYAGARGMIKGQCIDLNSEKKDTDGEEDGVRQLHLLKTSRLLTAPLVAGAILSNAEEQEIAAMREFGENLGLAFQIRDDIMDVLGTEEEMGKSTGSDEKKGKLTYVKVFGTERAQEFCDRYTKRALDALDAFGRRAEFLRELANALLDRKV